MSALQFDSDTDDELPPGWEERVTIEGRVYYANHHSESTQWQHPLTGKEKEIAGELPYGWEIIKDHDNKVYFVDHINKRTTYTDPRLAFAYDKEPKMKSSFREIKQRFDGQTRAREVLMGRDLSKIHAVVTGGCSGIGLETVRSLTLHGAHVVMPCRDLQKGKAVIDQLKQENPKIQAETSYMDLMNLNSVKAFVTDYSSKYKQLNLLVLNAGIFGGPFRLSDDGFESTFQTNYLAHMFLAEQFYERLRGCVPSRVIILTAESHRFSDLNQTNVSEEKLSPAETCYDSVAAYNQSKLCNLLWCLHYSKLHQGTGVLCNAVHPGNMIHTNLSNNSWLWKILFKLAQPFTKSKEQAAACTVFAATARELSYVNGEYFNNCCRCEPSPEASDRQLAEQLWDISQLMIQKATTLAMQN